MVSSFESGRWLDFATTAFEDIILADGARGMRRLRSHLPANALMSAAETLMHTRGRVLIATGFYIFSARAAETDGPIGAVSLGRALTQLGIEPVYVTDVYALPCIRALAGKDVEVVEFPIAGEIESVGAADRILRRVQPALSISIERCGLQPDGTYRNMRWVDISEWTARIDYLFLQTPTICIGDGGNEIGMGRLAEPIVSELSLPSAPIVGADHLILATVSNWGAYGLIAALSWLKGQNLLPDPDEAASDLARSVRAGVVDGVSGRRAESVDGFDAARQRAVLADLHSFIRSQRQC